MDPLARVQLLISDAIRLVAEDVNGREADPAVVNAVVARLRDAKAQLEDAQGQFSRRKAWQVTLGVLEHVVVELIIRALATSNCSPHYVRSIQKTTNDS